jgi:5-methylcytosine-specific restriction endonuclease McrA
MKKKQLIRQKFRDVCLKRDNYRCRVCGLKPEFDEFLDVHHITDRTEMPNGGYVLENGISLCSECHMKAERYHITGGLEWEHLMHPDDLYRKINSSHEEAVKASEKLNGSLA